MLGQKRKRNLFIAGGVIVVIIVSILAGYFLYYKRTPTYSLNLIRESVKKHDWETFQTHVDVDGVLSSAVDDLINEEMDKETDETTKQFANGIVKMLKPTLVSALKDEIKNSIENTNNNTANKKNNEAAKNIKENTDAKNAEFKDIAYVKKENNIATIGISLSDKQLNKTFVLDLQMRQLNDGTWQVTKISNLKDYMAAIEKAKEEKLDELNKPLKEQITQAINVGAIVPKIVNKDNWGFQKNLDLSVPLTITSDKEISSLSGNINVKNQNGKELLNSKFTINITNSNKTSNQYLSHELNPFISNDAEISKTNLNLLKITIDITGITYKDGNKVELYTKLPDNQ